MTFNGWSEAILHPGGSLFSLSNRVAHAISLVTRVRRLCKDRLGADLSPCPPGVPRANWARERTHNSPSRAIGWRSVLSKVGRITAVIGEVDENLAIDAPQEGLWS
jgi:hypothetical protein